MIDTNRLIVSTDLDGTLLDHHTYSWEAALPSIDRLRQLSIPIVINTSKTFAEVEQLQNELDLNAPFVVENGSAVYFPKGQHHGESIFSYNDFFDYQIIGKTRLEVLQNLKHLLEEFQYQFEGFNDWSVEDVIKHTGLSKSNAALAKNREYSEPIIWRDTEDRFQTFSQQIESKGFRIIRGGRFVHILGQANKGSALTALANVLFGSDEYTTICLGDSYNDLDMLEIADYPVFVRSPAHDFPEHSFDNKSNPPYFTKGYGPIGWNEAMHEILNSLEQNSGDTHG